MPEAAESEDAGLIDGLAALIAQETGGGAEPAVAEKDTGENAEADEAADDPTDGGEQPAEPEKPDPESAEDDGGDEAEGKDPAVDEKTAKSIAKIQAQEKRSREALASEREQVSQERAKLEAERQEWQESVGEFQKLRGRVRTNLPSVLKALGLSEEEFEDAARYIYAHSPAGQKDPKVKDVARRALADSDMDSRLEALERQNQELRQQIEQRSAEQRNSQLRDQFLAGVTAEITEESAPLASRRIKAAKSRAMAELAQISRAILEEVGEVPEFSDVVAEYERTLVEEAKGFGFDPEILLKPPTKSKEQNAGESKTAKSLSQELSPPATKPRTEPKSDAELDAEIIAGLQKLNSDDS